MQTIAFAELSIVFIPTAFLLVVMYRWRLRAWTGLYANARMLLQLLLVGYLLTYVFETTHPWIIVLLVVMMIAVSAWISLRSLGRRGAGLYLMVLVAIAVPGLVLLAIVTQHVLEMPRWFEPRLVVPIAGMIFASSMNTVSLAAERFEAEFERNGNCEDARRIALDAALIPQLNGLFAVGLVSLPGMMTGQVLAGIDPLVAVRYQIMVMWMIFGSGGIAAVMYLMLRARVLTRSFG